MVFLGMLKVMLCYLSGANFAPCVKPELAKAMALRKGVSLCWDLQLSNIIFKGGCQIVVNAANCPYTSETELSPIAYDIHFMMQCAQGWLVNYVPREPNHATHGMAKQAFPL